MHNLPTRLRDAAEALSGHGVSLYGGSRALTRIEGATREDVAVVQGRTIVQSARIQGVHYVAHHAVRAIEDLTDMEALAIQRNPLAEPRLKVIVDTATAACAHIVTETSWS